MAYRQLFGYGWWGTTWRLLLAILEGIVIMVVLFLAYSHIVRRAAFSPNQTIAKEIPVIALILAPTAAISIAAYYIGKFAASIEKNRIKQNNRLKW